MMVLYTVLIKDIFTNAEAWALEERFLKIDSRHLIRSVNLIIEMLGKKIQNLRRHKIGDNGITFSDIGEQFSFSSICN